MDNELATFSNHLCRVAGIIMEDPNLLAVSNVEAFARSERLDQLTIAADNLVALIAAAKVLAQLG